MATRTVIVVKTETDKDGTPTTTEFGRAWLSGGVVRFKGFTPDLREHFVTHGVHSSRGPVGPKDGDKFLTALLLDFDRSYTRAREQFLDNPEV
jgi:hypothetical protein